MSPLYLRSARASDHSPSSILELTELPAFVIAHRFRDLALAVHHERPVLNDRLRDGFTVQDQQLGVGVRLELDTLTRVGEEDEVVFRGGPGGPPRARALLRVLLLGSGPARIDFRVESAILLEFEMQLPFLRRPQWACADCKERR